jgi:serine/threonine protein kinase
MKLQLDGGGAHPLFMMVTDCLDDDAYQRPSCQDILKRGIFTEMFPGGNEEQVFGPDTVVEATSVILGHGAFGSVIEVECRGKLYAAKRFHPENEFNEEHKILAHIRHRNIVPYHGMCKLAPDNTPVLVMERMEMNLGTYLTAEQNTNLTLDRKFEILQDVIQGLNHIHTHSPIIIHRDLTAQNVLLDAQGTAKIGDFGNSYTVKLNVAMQELPSAAPGTMNYMPPEAQEAGEFDEKIDVFSFGHLALYVMIQHPPHPLLAHTYTVEGVHHARSEVQRRQLYLDEVTDNLPKRQSHPLFPVLTRCLNDDPKERPSSAEILDSNVLVTHDGNEDLMESFIYTDIDYKDGTDPTYAALDVGPAIDHPTPATHDTNPTDPAQEPTQGAKYPTDAAKRPRKADKVTIKDPPEEAKDPTVTIKDPREAVKDPDSRCSNYKGSSRR